MNIKLLKRNPEFARNVQQELTKQRLIAMPVILFLLALLVLSVSDIGYNYRGNKYDNLAKYASIAFVIIASLWGAKSAADGVLNEYNGRTWDWQRMSTLSPWKMTIGKLFGSTIFNWYGGIICVIIYLLSTCASNAIYGGMNSSNAFNDTRLLYSITDIINSIFIAISIQGIAILASLMQMKKGDGRSKIKVTAIIIFPIILLMITWIDSGLMYRLGFLQYQRAFWYGMNLGFFRTILTSMFYASWIIAGLYRTMRTELQYTNGLKWWVLFLISSAIFNAGFILGQHNNSNLQLGITMAFAMQFLGYAFITFAMTLLEPKEIIGFRMVIKYFKEKNFDKLYTILPLWTISLLFLILSGIVTSVLVLTLPDNFIESKLGGLFYNNFFFEKLKAIRSTISAAPFAMIGFLLRDIALIFYVNLLKKNKRADATAILYLFILHLVIPLIIRSSSIGFIFYPSDSQGFIAMIGAPFFEAFAMIVILVRKWNDVNSRIEEI